jgi:hypothetical protein
MNLYFSDKDVYEEGVALYNSGLKFWKNPKVFESNVLINLGYAGCFSNFF